MKITISLAQIGATALVVLNILLVALGGWLLNRIWENTIEFRNETDGELKKLRSELAQFRVDLSSGYVTQESFNDYRAQVTESIRYIDSKFPLPSHNPPPSSQ